MANYNKVILVGNLTRDPQLSYLPSQTPVVEFGMAMNRTWTDRQTGQKREETCFVDCRAYGRQAETINQYMSKGRSMLVEGRLQLDTWEGKDGTRRSKHRIFVERAQFLGGGGGAARQAPPQQPATQAPQPHAGPQTPPPPVDEAPPPADETHPEPPPDQYDDNASGDDIPF